LKRLLNRIVRLYHTIKYLKPKQIIWRIIGVFPRYIREINVYPKTINERISSVFIHGKNITTDYDHFEFLNETKSLRETGWDNEFTSKLWRYNLHYFDCLLQVDSSDNQLEAQISLIDNWIVNNPFGKGTAWETYPTSLRIINWIKWHWQCGGLSHKAKLSLWNQIRWLNNRPEYHLLGNHLFLNAKALLFASAFFNFDYNSIYFKKAFTILQKELEEQFFEDGAHFELSPMYHSLAMEDLLDLISISQKLPNIFPRETILKKYFKGMSWLKTMSYSNQELAHFNDCANGIAPTYSELETYANRLCVVKVKTIIDKLQYHKDSGFVVYKDVKSHLIADFGKIGPTYLPGHAHADTLSFELAVNGHRVIVNSGTSEYGNSKERLRQRGTSAHSTVEIDKLNSSEVWSGFRVARRAVPYNIQININTESDNQISFYACHDGYIRLKNVPIHSRKFSLLNNIWNIEDEVTANGNIVFSRFYLHPEISAKKTQNGIILSKNNIDLLKFNLNTNIDLKIIESTYHDQFGISRANNCIQLNGISPIKIEIKLELL
jgi:uncharacterized heparinase superfamily protein